MNPKRNEWFTGLPLKARSRVGWYNQIMRARTVPRTLWLAGAAAVALGAALNAQAPAIPQQPPPATQQPVMPTQREVIRRSIDLVTTDVIVRDNRGQFIADLKKADFEVFEDGVKQDVVNFVLTHGGRVLNVEAPPPPPPQEGIILPPVRPTSDASGRIFIIFVDDLHLDFRNTGRIRDLFKKISKELIHEGDMFGIVSTGPSSIAIDLTYDRKRLDEAIKKITGSGLKPSEILEVPEGADGPPEVKYRANVAFSTAYDLLKTLEQVHNRRKAFIYVSNGYDFNPFSTTRAKNEAERLGQMNQNTDGTDGSGSSDSSDSGVDPFRRTGNQFSFADLSAQLSELTREANRANTTMYTIDPRGLVGMPDLDEKVDMMEWQDYITTSQNSLRVIAELTGGIAVVNQNDFDKALKRIDAETSDYYVIGYYSSNPDPTKRRRSIEVRVSRPNVSLNYRTSYVLKPRPSR
jgi:VWFA-related protein